jgi:SNF2 family DNA or RNA helicase
MIEFFKNEENQSLAIKIGGPRFDELKDCLKENKFSFKFIDKRFPYIEKIWIKDIKKSRIALEELSETFSIKIPSDIWELSYCPPETKKIRNPIRSELLLSEPKGEYQLRTISKANKQNRLLFAHKMGLGKTFMIISTLNHLWAKGLIDKVLIISPAESVYNFKRELIKFSTFAKDESRIYTADAKHRDPFQDSVDVVLMKYRTFLMLSDDAYKKKHTTFSKDYRSATLDLGSWGSSRAIVLDESHFIKNKGARQTKVLQAHKKFFEYRYLLSGTPWPTGVKDLYSQIKFLDETLIPVGYNEWIKTIAEIGTRWSQYEINHYREEDVKEFLKKVDDWIIREFLEDNIKIPEQFIKKIWVPLNKKQEKIYKSYISYKMVESKEENGRYVVKQLYRDFPNISLALDNPCILKNKIESINDSYLKKILSSWEFKDHSKLESCSSLLDTYIGDGSKVILWSGHPLTIQQLGEYYKKYNPILIHGELEIPKGSSKDQQRDYLLEKFKSQKKNKLLIASYLVLSTAVNIIEATRMIYFDRNWNFTYWAQSKERNHRIGTTFQTIVNPLIFDNTLENHQDRIIEGREALDKELMNYDSLSKDQWKNLFEGKEIE